MQNGVNALANMVSKNLFFFSQKAKNFVHFGPYYLVQISLAYVSNNIWSDFRLPMSAFATVVASWQCFNGKFTAEIDFHFMLSLLNADIGSLNKL